MIPKLSRGRRPLNEIASDETGISQTSYKVQKQGDEEKDEKDDGPQGRNRRRRQRRRRVDRCNGARWQQSRVRGSILKEHRR